MPFGTVTLNDGNEMPTIAFGTGSKWKGQDVTDYVSEAIEAGFSHIDTAQFYANEDSVGTAIRQSGLNRSDLFITTKWSGLASVRESIEASLSKLNLKQVDLYLIHNPAVVKDLEADWRSFEIAQADGLVKSIGVSNFSVELMQKLVKIAKVKPTVNQIMLHPYNYAQNKELLEYCAKHKVIVEAYSSLSPITSLPGGPVDKPVNAAAKRLGATPAQVIQAWVRAKGVVIVTTSSSQDRMKEYLAVADLLLASLTDEEIAAIDAAGAQGPPSMVRRDVRLAVLFCWSLVMLWQLVHMLR
ncbi:Aldo/keto reductase [Wolfiporia cocos MD-104 SS10]|uniref:Aldo/keto reductase n=1 Tax=Wolfiporia cocos (strain MD-104) TaxID=742152 RepID=A0A2H3JDI0_WOLCO|nr:Aldo/keto reductase [Wolfiporia cocos MD-104 SS10]